MKDSNSGGDLSTSAVLSRLTSLRVIGLVALVPALVSSLDRASDHFLHLELVPSKTEAVASVAAILGVVALLAVARRWHTLELRIRADTEALLQRFQSEGAERIEALERRVRVRDVVRAGDTMQVVYQPVVSLDDSHVSGYEALARFDSGNPSGWFQEAHELGMGVELEVLAARRAIDGFAPGRGRLAINLSPDALVSDQIHGLLVDGLARYDIVVEVTEHAAVTDYDRLHAALAPFRELGLLVAIDDAGAGFASFRHVVALQPNIIKLDRSLISGISSDHARTSLARSLGQYAASMDIVIVAEGIETPDELEACRLLGFAAGQGYLLGRPGPLPDPVPHVIDLS